MQNIMELLIGELPIIPLKQHIATNWCDILCYNISLRYTICYMLYSIVYGTHTILNHIIYHNAAYRVSFYSFSRQNGQARYHFSKKSRKLLVKSYFWSSLSADKTPSTKTKKPEYIRWELQTTPYVSIIPLLGKITNYWVEEITHCSLLGV